MKAEIGDFHAADHTRPCNRIPSKACCYFLLTRGSSFLIQAERRDWISGWQKKQKGVKWRDGALVLESEVV
jgi:hypothetical protein